MSDLVLAIDIGGTKIATAIMDAAGIAVVQREIATPSRAPAEQLFEALIDLCSTILVEVGLETSALLGLGVGCAGPMRYPEGLVSPLNIPAWRDFPLRPRLEAWSGRPVVVDNDAKAYALGEYWIGGGTGAQAMLGIVVSTGVGGGIVVDGRLLHGAHGNAGHIGHVIAVPNGPRCACGARGCVEAIAKGPSLARRARQRGLRPPPATAAEVAQRAYAGDPLARRLFDEAGFALGRGIAAAANLVDLDRVVIGGGVSRSAELFWPSLLEAYRSSARLDFARDLDIRVSELRVSASLAGAAALVFLA